jgi:hypothetical protein
MCACMFIFIIYSMLVLTKAGHVESYTCAFMVIEIIFITAYIGNLDVDLRRFFSFLY